MDPGVLAAVIAAVASVVGAYALIRVATINARSLLAIASMGKEITTLKEQTNHIKDALVAVTGEAAFSAGAAAQRDLQEADPEAGPTTTQTARPPVPQPPPPTSP